MAKYVLQELPGEMTDGKKIVYPKMQTYSLQNCLLLSILSNINFTKVSQVMAHLHNLT